MTHSMKYKRLAKKLGAKSDKPGSLISRMHSLKGMPKKHKLPKTFGGKSTKPGMGGRAKILEAKGVPKGVIGAIARSKGEAPGQAGFHKKHKMGESDFKKHKEISFKHRKNPSTEDGLKEPHEKHKMACKAHHKMNCKVC